MDTNGAIALIATTKFSQLTTESTKNTEDRTE